MSTKLSKGKVKNKDVKIDAPNLLMGLENVILAMESQGLDETTIFGFVNCILKGFIRNGKFTPEYLANVERVIAERKLTPERIAEMQEAERIAELRAAFGGTSVSSS